MYARLADGILRGRNKSGALADFDRRYTIGIWPFEHTRCGGLRWRTKQLDAQGIIRKVYIQIILKITRFKLNFNLLVLLIKNNFFYCSYAFLVSIYSK
jgi:hypothetical protein